MAISVTLRIALSVKIILKLLYRNPYLLLHIIVASRAFRKTTIKLFFLLYFYFIIFSILYFPSYET